MQAPITKSNKRDIYGIGIETSCDETSVALVKNGNELIASPLYSQIELHQKYGGVVPENSQPFSS